MLLREAYYAHVATAIMAYYGHVLLHKIAQLFSPYVRSYLRLHCIKSHFN
jgi:hypothetical protein